MLFIFLITAATFLCYTLEINGFSVHIKNDTNENEINSSFNESVTESGSVMAKHKSLFHIIQNPNDSPNLKSNIFDRMLSNEMLSIKQQIYEKNETNITPIYLTFKNSIPTPKLEVKQLWPIDKPFTQEEVKYENASIKEKSQSHTAKDQNDFLISKKDENGTDYNKIKYFNKENKVLGVRSFSDVPVQPLESTYSHQYTKRLCSCMKTNQHTTCSFRCSEHRKATCTQADSSVTASLQCTRNLMPLTYYPYYAYSTLFLGFPTEPSVIYYHPDVINELKLPKHKYKPNKKPSVDNIHFEDDGHDNDYSDSEDSQEEDLKTTKRHKSKTYETEKPKTIYWTDYKADNSIPGEEHLNDGYLQVLDRDKFIEEVVEDLKVYYSDAVIKDCYCSLSTFKFRTESLIIYVPIFAMLIMFYTFNIECY